MNIDLYCEAEKNYIQGNYEKAFEIFEQLYKSGKSKYDSLNYMGCCQLALNNYEEALRLFDEVSLNNPLWERPVFNKARVYLELKDFNSSIDCLRQAEKINPNSEDVYYYMGKYYYDVEKYQDAKCYFLKSIEINTLHVESHLAVGVIYLDLAEYDNAIFEFNKVIMIATNNQYHNKNILLSAFYNKALVYYNQNKYKNALAELFEAYKFGSDIDVLLLTSQIYFELQDYDKTLNLIEELEMKELKNDKIDNLRIVAKRKLNQRELFRNAISIALQKENINGVSLGDGEKKIFEIFGLPYRTEQPNESITYLYYKKCTEYEELYARFRLIDGILINYAVKRCTKYTTAKGVKIGDNIERVILGYGKGYYTRNEDDKVIVGYVDKAIKVCMEFTLKGDKIIQIKLEQIE